MDRFELNWPGADASFYTDGWRCRIVWRQKGRRGGGGMGGTIDNNQQCVKRAAESLEGAPYLLSALKARGHARLADQIEIAAAEAPGLEPAGQPTPVQPAPAHPAPVRAERRERPKIAKKRPAPKRVDRASDEKTWLDSLKGDTAFEAAANKRAKAWLALCAVGDEALLLKAPAAKGNAEWVLKRTWPEDAKRKPEYVVAASFKGIASFLVAGGAKAADIESALAALAEVSHPELETAAKAWRAAGATH